MKTKVAVLGLLFLASLSGVELGAVRYNALFGGTYPGVQLPDEEPDCWFSFAEKQAAAFVETPSSLGLNMVDWNAQGQLMEYYPKGTHSIPGGSEVVTAHLYNAVRDNNNKITGWTEIRHYSKSQNTYVFRVSNVKYDFSGKVLYGYRVDFPPSVPGILISGTITTQTGAGILGVAVTGQPADFPSTVHTTSTGFYEIAVPALWSGMLTPTLENYRFTPTSKSYSSVTQPRTNQNFTGTPIVYVTISGVIQDSEGIEVAGVSLEGFTEAVTTDASGVYSGRVESGTTPVIRPVKACYAFTPEQRTYNTIGSSLVNQDYTGTRTGIVPDVKGKPLDQTQADIAAAGLSPGCCISHSARQRRPERWCGKARRQVYVPGSPARCIWQSRWYSRQRVH